MKRFDFKKFGEYISKCRTERHGITLQGLADVIGISRATCIRAQNGSDIDIHTVINLCDWMDCSITTFIIKKVVKNGKKKKTKRG